MRGLRGRRLDGGTVVVPDPDVYVFGGSYDTGADVHGYSQRGSASRAVAHPAAAGGHGGAGEKAMNRTTHWTETDLMNL